MGENTKMKTTKILLMITIFIGMVISFTEYREYHKKEIINECINTKEEEMIVSCIENPKLIKYSQYPKTIQNAYDFSYSHKDFQFKDKNIQYIFIFNYAMNVSDCKGTKECNLHDAGKGYDIALNNCLMNNNCTDILKK